MLFLPRSFQAGLQVRVQTRRLEARRGQGDAGASLDSRRSFPSGRGGGGGTNLWSPTLPEVPCPHHPLHCQGPHCRVLTVGGCGGLAWPGPALWGRRASHMMRTVGPASSPVWTGGRVWENRALSLPPVLRWRGVRVAPGFPSFVPPDLESILAASRRSRSEGRWVSPPETHPPSLRPLWAVVSRGRPRSCSELAGPSSGLAPGGFAES